MLRYPSFPALVLSLVAAGVLLPAGVSGQSAAPSLDFEEFRTKVQPIFTRAARPERRYAPPPAA